MSSVQAQGGETDAPAEMRALLKACVVKLSVPAGPHLTDLAWAIMREISKMSYNVSNADILRARNQLKASLLFSQDNTSGAPLHQPRLLSNCVARASLPSECS